MLCEGRRWGSFGRFGNHVRLVRFLTVDESIALGALVFCVDSLVVMTWAFHQTLNCAFGREPTTRVRIPVDAYEEEDMDKRDGTRKNKTSL